jgi:segregation and condensation protein B
VAELSIDYEGRGIELIEVAGGFQFRSAPGSAPFVRDLVAQRPARLTRAQLETLALIAYRQPITRPEIDDVRGVDSGSAIKVLLDRDLLKILGRKDEAGRPLLYGTAPFFLEFFGMNSMQDLPTLKEFTELSAEHRDLFQRKTGDIPDLSSDAETGAATEPAPLESVADDHSVQALQPELDQANALEDASADDASASLDTQFDGPETIVEEPADHADQELPLDDGAFVSDEDAPTFDDAADAQPETTADAPESADTTDDQPDDDIQA